MLENQEFEDKKLAITRPVLTGLLVLLALVLVFLAWPVYALFAPVRIDGSHEITISEGSGLLAIGQQLKNEGVVRSVNLFVGYAKISGVEKDLKAGRYVFEGNLNIPDVVQILSGNYAESDDIVVTIPEGMNVWEIDKMLTDRGLISEGRFSSIALEHEGYLFPDTYHLNNPETAGRAADSAGAGKPELVRELLDKMLANFEAKTEGLFDSLSADGAKNAIVIVASMLEKEGKKEEDMRTIAGIIYKRQELGMLLQIDAAVTYGACRRDFLNGGMKKNCDVTWVGVAYEIPKDGPYNVYVRAGLPAGPISNPGLNALRAALDPQPSDYLYYLSTRDGSEIIYSKTAQEHNANRRKYLGL